MNHRIALFVIVTLVISIPLTLFVLQRPQENRSRASASTTLSFSPNSTASSPIAKKVGDNVSVDIMVDPGTHMVTFIKFQVRFDPAKIALEGNQAFVLNRDAFPSIVEGPVITNDSLAASVSIGGDPTKAITKVTKLGTINFKAIAPTNNQNTLVTFTTISQALSAASTDQAGENTLSTTNPANISIANSTPSTTPGLTGSPSATLTPRPTGTSTILLLDVLLHGVGAAGDNPNPRGADLSNKNPLHPQRDITIEVLDSNNNVVKEGKDAIVYDSGKGNFKGTIDLGPNFPDGNYTLKMKTDRYLRKQVSGVVFIENMNENKVPQTALVAGDVKSDNILNVLDYNILRDCGFGSIEPLPVADPNSLYNSTYCKSHSDFRPNADIDDNGIVNSPDYNLFLRELSVQSGD